MKDEDFKIKLILPAYGSEFFKAYSPGVGTRCLPYGMGVLTAFLKEKKIHVEQEDLSFKFVKKGSGSSYSALKIFETALLDKLRLYEAGYRFVKLGKMEIEKITAPFVDRILDYHSMREFNIIGFSIFSFHQFLFALMVAPRLKQKTNATIVFGGAYINRYGSLLPADIFNSVDYIILGDGRIPLLKLISYLRGKAALSEVPNLIYRTNGGLVSNPKEYYPLEDIPTPDFEGIPVHLYENPYDRNNVMLPYEISRGCTNRCSFCSYVHIHDSRLEFKSYGKVLGELRQMKERYKSNAFFFCDDTINNSYQYLEGLCDLFIKNKLYIKWGTHARVDNLDRNLLMKMAKAGCCGLAFGIESGSNRILESMNKGFTAEQANATIKDAADAGIKVVISLIAGYPHETKEDIGKTIEFIRKNKENIHYAAIYSFFLNYGSPMYFNPERYGIKNLSLIPIVFSYTFDEMNGLKWKQKNKQRKHRRRQLAKVIYDNLEFGKEHKLYFLFFVFYIFLSSVINKIFKVYLVIKFRSKEILKK